MGINSTGVAYDFGQLGSAFSNLAKPIYPPKGHVIVAVQFLSNNTPTEMITETLDPFGPQFPGTDDTEATAANYLGVTKAACTSNRSTVFTTNDTVEIDAVNPKIKKGQYVLLVNDTDPIDLGLTVDAETPTPVYNGPNQQGVKVVKVDGVNITLDTVLSPSSAQTLVFIDEQHGVGGTTTEGVTFPAGMTIYGRWTKITPAADSVGGVICYFGK